MSSGGQIRVSRRLGWLLCAILGFLIAGNLYLSGRHYVSDVHLNRALEAEDSGAALDCYGQSVATAPERIRPRYEQFIYYCRNPDVSSEPVVRQAFDEIEAVIPNYKNVSEFYASYLAEIGDFSGAAKQMHLLGEQRAFHLMYLADAAFYFSVSQNAEGARVAMREILFRAFLAESRGARGTLQSVEWLGPERQQMKVRFDDRVETLRADMLGARIPGKVRFNQIIFRYYALAETHRILSETIDGLDAPRFLEVLSADDRDKVLRLVTKLNEVDTGAD